MRNTRRRHNDGPRSEQGDPPEADEDWRGPGVTGRTLSCLRPCQSEGGGDRARMPVTLPCESDGQMHRDGRSAAVRMQPETAVAECGRVHGAPELDVYARMRVSEKISVDYRRGKDERRCIQGLQKNDRLRGQDKADFQSARPAPASCCLHIVFRSGKRRRSGA